MQFTVEFTIFAANKIFGACRPVACTKRVHKRYLSVVLGRNCMLFDASSFLLDREQYKLGLSIQ